MHVIHTQQLSPEMQGAASQMGGGGGGVVKSTGCMAPNQLHNSMVICNAKFIFIEPHIDTRLQEHTLLHGYDTI